jgi:hypothetical protein
MVLRRLFDFVDCRPFYKVDVYLGKFTLSVWRVGDQLHEPDFQIFNDRVVIGNQPHLKMRAGRYPDTIGVVKPARVKPSVARGSCVSL